MCFPVSCLSRRFWHWNLESPGFFFWGGEGGGGTAPQISTKYSMWNKCGSFLIAVLDKAFSCEGHTSTKMVVRACMTSEKSSRVLPSTVTNCSLLHKFYTSTEFDKHANRHIQRIAIRQALLCIIYKDNQNTNIL